MMCAFRDLNKDYQEHGADSEFELAINHDQAVKSWNGLRYWDVYRDGVWEDSIYLNEGNLPLSHTTHTVKTPVGTVKSRAARLMMRFPQNRDRPRKPPLLTWMGIPQLTLKWNSRDENTARKRGCSKAIESLVMQVTEPKTHPVEQSWKLLKTESINLTSVGTHLRIPAGCGVGVVLLATPNSNSMRVTGRLLMNP